MEFNRLISLVIGFIVLILVFVWIGSKFRSTTKTVTAQKVTVTLTKTPTPSPSKGQSKGWNPFAFLFNRSNTPTPTPAKVVVTKITSIPTVTPAGIVITTNKGGTQVTEIQNEGETVVVYRNNKTGKTVTMNNGSVITANNKITATPTNAPMTKNVTIKKIPETGAPTMLIPLAFSAFTLGAYLRKRV